VKLLRACLIPAILLAAALFAAPQANAQYVYGYSLVSLSGSTVYSWSYTELDYVSSGSYSVETDAYPSFASSASGTGSSSALVGATGSASPGNAYWVQTNHWVIAYGSDPYGFGGISANYYNEAFYAYPTGTSGAGGSFWVGTTWYTAYYGSPPSISEVDGTDYAGYVIIWGTDLTDSSDDTQVTVDGSYVSLAYVSTAQVNAYYSAGVGNHSLYLTTPYGTAYTGFTVNPYWQTIYFYSLSNVTYGAAPFGISASTTSGLPVTFTSNTTGVCTVSGTTVTLVSIGTCSITASQAGNATYAAAASVTETFTVIPASQSISFGPIGNVPLGAGPLTLTASASSGLAVSIASNTPATCSTSGLTVTPLAAGTCSITASQPGNSMFSAATSVTQSLSITNYAPPSIPNSYTGSPAALPCADITGNWIVTPNGGSGGAEWDLAPSGSGFQGTSYINSSSCGVVSSTISATLNGDGTFTITDSGRAPCGNDTFPPSTQSNISITGNSCSNGSFTANGNGYTLTSKQSTTGNPVATSTATTSHYRIEYAGYIPVDNVYGPLPCSMLMPFNWLRYKGDAYRGTARVQQAWIVIPGAQHSYNFWANTGPTRNYAPPSPQGPNDANGNRTLLSTLIPGDDPYGGLSYSGADEDMVADDCFAWKRRWPRQHC